MLPLVLVVLGYLIRYSYSQIVGGVDVSKLPICAQGCIENNTGSAYGCSITDIKCVCSSIPYINALSCCLEKECSSSDQNAALAFDLALCASYNISIPNFLGCSPLSSTPAGSIITAPQATSSATMAGSGSEPTVSTVTNIMSAFVTTTTGGPVATFGGQMILTGSCTVPRIAIYELPTGGLLEYPWVGCSPESPECCPFPLAQEGPLTICPTDYFTTGSMCCPSGWSLLSTELVPYLTPCVTSPTVALLPPSATLSSSVTASIISTQLYTLSYALAAPSSSALSTGAKVGIALGVVAGIFFLLLAYIFIRRYRAHRDQAVRNATILRTDVPYSRGSAHTTPVSPYNKRATFISGGTPSMHSVNQTSPVATEPVPELPSPPPPVSPTRNAYWPGNAAVAGVRAPGATSPGQMGSAAGSRVGSPGSQASGAMEPVMELPGSTFLHEHHPMYLGPEAKGEPAGGSAAGENAQMGF